MKKVWLFLFVIVLFSCSEKKLSEQQLAILWNAYNAHNYFKLNDLIQKTDSKASNPELLLFKAKLNYVFNKPAQSDSLIDIILAEHQPCFNDTIIADLYYMKAYNETNLENYADATKSGNYLIEKFSNLYDSALISEFRDDTHINEVLTGQPKMVIEQLADEKIAVSRDIAGLLNIPVVMKSDTINFVFDTGASMSVIVNSVAEKYGFKTLGKKVYVLAFTGKRLEAELALGDISIGNMRIRNNVFLVFPDSMLTFANGAYVIKGVIGFPVMRAFRELAFSGDSLLSIPQSPATGLPRNFALDNAAPVILVVYKNDSLPFHFDTGADRTVLYHSFFKMYKDSIEKSGTITRRMMGGAGGVKEVEAYVMKKVLLQAGNAEALLDSCDVLIKAISDEKTEYYGNFGQDYIKQFKEMRINFASMNISFSK